MTGLHPLLLEPVIAAALREDFGRRGDLTSDSVIPPDRRAKAVLRARSEGRIAGLEAAQTAFRLTDPALFFTAHVSDGDDAAAGVSLAIIEGPARALLTAERTALNFLCHLSGIATATRTLVKAIGSHKAKLCCTRKTTPGLRALEKYAVTMGGGVNHRFGLDDAILIKDNHIAVAGSIAEAVTRARNVAGHMIKIEVEVDTLAQLDEVLRLPIDAVLLDNMSPAQMAQAVKTINGKIIAEASGRITVDNVGPIAASGVDLISSGWITHSAPILDIGLDIDV